MSDPVTEHRLAEIGRLYASGRLPEGVAAMQALAACGSAAEARAGLAPEASALAALLTDQAYALVSEMLALADHSSAATPEAWAEVFDRAARLSPEASVALYSLGDERRLAQATLEVAGWLEAEGLLGPGRRVLEVGCGIGRFLVALASKVESIVGVDVSPVMCAEAAARLGRAPGAGVARTDGRSLAALKDAAFDLVLFIDSFPYVINAGLGRVMLAEAERVLRPGGAILVLNWSYRGDGEEDDAEARTWAAELGLRLDEEKTPGLVHWNGTVHRLCKPC